MQSIESFARGYGLSVQSVPSNRAYVYLTGTVGQMQRAFATTIRNYLLDGTTVRVPTRAASVPARLAPGGDRRRGAGHRRRGHAGERVATPPAPRT